MKSLFTGKVWVILLVFAALVGLVVLASGLNGMKFDAPNMVRLDNFFRFSNSSIPADRDQNQWLRYFVLGMFVLLFLAMLGPVRPQSSKSLIMQLVRLLAFTVIAMVVMSRFARNNPMFSAISTPPRRCSRKPATGASSPGLGREGYWKRHER